MNTCKQCIWLFVVTVFCICICASSYTTMVQERDKESIDTLIRESVIRMEKRVLLTEILMLIDNSDCPQSRLIILEYIDNNLQSLRNETNRAWRVQPEDDHDQDHNKASNTTEPVL